MRPFPPRLLPAALILIAASTGFAVAQTTPLPLPPPGQAGTAPSAVGKVETGARTRKPKRRNATVAPKLDRTRDPALTEGTAARPRRYVPEEFEEDPRAPRPIMSPSGRAGVGMRF